MNKNTNILTGGGSHACVVRPAPQPCLLQTSVEYHASWKTPSPEHISGGMTSHPPFNRKNQILRYWNLLPGKFSSTLSFNCILPNWQPANLKWSLFYNSQVFCFNKKQFFKRERNQSSKAVGKTNSGQNNPVSSTPKQNIEMIMVKFLFTV